MHAALCKGAADTAMEPDATGKKDNLKKPITLRPKRTRHTNTLTHWRTVALTQSLIFAQCSMLRWCSAMQMRVFRPCIADVVMFNS